MARVDSLGVELDDLPERGDVVVKVLEHRGAFAQDAVATENSVVFLKCHFIKLN